jgi:hypothetical protein
MSAAETLMERKRREADDRATADFLMPGVPSQLDAAGNALRAAVEMLEDAQTRLQHKTASDPMERLCIAANLLSMPFPFVTKLLDEFGPEGVEPLLDEIDRHSAQIRAAMQNISRSEP